MFVWDLPGATLSTLTRPLRLCGGHFYLMSPSFLPITVLMVEMAALVFCPAWERVSWVFLYLQEGRRDGGEEKVN